MVTQISNATKVCTGCSLEKSALEFGNHRNTKDGKNHKCKSCCNLRTQVYRQINQEKLDQERIEKREEIRAYNREYRAKNRERIRLGQRKRYGANREEFAEKSKLYRLKNPEKPREWQRRWVKDNGYKRCLSTAKRRSMKRAATPKWANEFLMLEVYELADLRTRVMGVKWHVDHIVPIISKIVCGLHCEQNMRVIPQKENISKGNRHWPDMP